MLLPLTNGENQRDLAGMDIRKRSKSYQLINEKTGVMEELHETNDKEKEESVRISRASTMTVYLAPPLQPPKTQFQQIFQPPMQKNQPLLPTGQYAIKSPMAGRVYLSATQELSLCRNFFDNVKEGETVCIIEAMKMFNQITADKAGVISARVVENEQVVNSDQDLFIIEE